MNDSNKILITGFEPFGPYKINLSEIMARKLDKKIIKIKDKQFEIVSSIIPIRFDSFRIPNSANFSKIGLLC